MARGLACITVRPPAISNYIHAHHVCRVHTVVTRNLNYWDSAASFAGDVENPGKTYPRALFSCVILVILVNVLPVLVGTGSSAVAAAAAVASSSGSDGDDATIARWSLWEDGYFADVATAIAGRWLGVWVVLSAAAANVGLFEAEMSSDAMQVMGMVRNIYRFFFLSVEIA